MRKWNGFQIVTAGVAILGLVAIILLLMTGHGMAEKELETVYVLCNPESYVNIREKPGKSARKAGFASCGDDFTTDGVKKRGYLHVFASTETGEGWISEGYIVYCKPEEVGEVWEIESNGRVAVRSTIGGKRTRWMRNGDEVMVYWVAEVAVTSKGFIDAMYIGPGD